MYQTYTNCVNEVLRRTAMKEIPKLYLNIRKSYAVQMCEQHVPNVLVGTQLCFKFTLHTCMLRVYFEKYR